MNMHNRARVAIDRDRCKGCMICVDACTAGVLDVDVKLNRRGVHPVKPKDNAACTGCGLCAVVCPDGAIRVYRIQS